MNYQHYISFNGSDFTEITIEQPQLETQKGEYAFYRTECNDLRILQKLNSSVYSTLNTWFTDDTKFSTEISYEIYRGTRATGTLMYQGFFSISDAQMDKDNGVFRVKPQIDDTYRDIMNLVDTDFTMQPALFGVTNLIYSRTCVIKDAWTAAAGRTTFNTFTATAGTISSFIATDTNDRGNSAQLDGGVSLVSGYRVLVEVSAVSDNPYIDIEDTSGNSITAGGQEITATGIYVFVINADQPAEICVYNNSTTLDGSITFTVRIGEKTVSNSCDTFMNVIENYLSSALYMNLTGFSGNVKSTFINNDALPTGAPSSISSWMTTNPDGNYASEVTASNELNDFCITMTENWVGADPAGFERSFTQFMEDLFNTIRAKWFIDADGDFRIEHEKYFEKQWEDSTALDVTGILDQKRELEFDKSLLANREQFSWAQAENEDFIGEDIIYDNLETIGNTKKYTVGNVTTDMKYLVDNQDDASGSGYCFVIANAITGYREIQVSEGLLSGGQISNAAMSWANLHDSYWKWERMSENGDMNDGDTISFESAVKFLKIKNVKFPYTSDIDGFTKVTVEDGTGQQEVTVRDLRTDFVEMELMFNPYA